ncbi:MAG: hypothetical protein NUW21_08555 [Elusimicrobia bacterium]|nr:hypothetical protein [Elusimicrobiota bacterium]
MADPRLDVMAVPRKGAFEWPGRESLDERTRILFESRTLKELAYATGTIDAENLESVLGFWEYLQADWRWLHDPEFRAENPEYFSWHNASLREGGHYLRETHWKGGIPETESVSEYLDTLTN